jgi:3'-phosphoadenosine 5'-phosphosulfate sulfotransferase (PAPS reductase)/FAD synthetase
VIECGPTTHEIAGRDDAADAIAAGAEPIVSVSGGKDSTATILAMREHGVACRYVFADTGWEVAETYEYLAYLADRLGIWIDRVGAEGGFEADVLAHRGFPPVMNGWCSRELKHAKIREYHEEQPGKTIAVTGQRAEESATRAGLPVFGYEPKDRQTFWRPIIRFTVAEVLAIHRYHGVRLNPLYRRDFDRVGCMPCKNETTKGAILRLLKHFPERIDRIRALEAEVARLRAAAPGNESPDTATFYRGRTIDEAVAWARTSRGGKQLAMYPVPASGGCMRWGVCDVPAQEAS